MVRASSLPPAAASGSIDWPRRSPPTAARSHGVALDVTDRAAIAEAFDAAEQAFGTVTLLVNAGISGSLKRGLEISEEDWRALMRSISTPCGLPPRRQPAA